MSKGIETYYEEALLHVLDIVGAEGLKLKIRGPSQADPGFCDSKWLDINPDSIAALRTFLDQVERELAPPTAPALTPTALQIQALYLDYVNNFITVTAFAEHYDLEVWHANLIIEQGRRIQEGVSACGGNFELPELRAVPGALFKDWEGKS